MNTTFLPRLLAFLFIALSFFPALADAPLRKVTVTGNATITIAPDEMNWSASIDVYGGTAAAAKEIHDASLNSVLNYLKGLGDAIKDLQTDGIRLNKVNWTSPAPEGKAFTCETRFTFTLTDYSKYGAIADTLAKIDSLQVQSVDYATSKQEALENEALKKALVNAHDKASELAQVAGCYIDKPLEILEGTPNIGPRPIMMMAKSLGGGTPAAVPGQIEISGTVTATYDLYYK